MKYYILLLQIICFQPSYNYKIVEFTEYFNYILHHISIAQVKIDIRINQILVWNMETIDLLIKIFRAHLNGDITIINHFKARIS